MAAAPTSLGAAVYSCLATPTTPPRPRPGRGRPILPCRATASSGAGEGAVLDRRRRPQNVAGDFFVGGVQEGGWQGRRSGAAQLRGGEDQGPAGVALLPNIFNPHRETSKRHPPSAKHVSSTNRRQNAPGMQQFPFSYCMGVYLCGYNSQDTFGATSYLVIHPQGNILIDSPRYTPKLANNIEKLGGARYMFLTHIDNLADHRKWAERLKCERIIHSEDMAEGTEDVEWKLEGNGPWDIGTDFELIHTPGHTPGSVCLYYKSLKVLFTGDHVAKSEESDDLVLFLMYNRQPVSLQLDNITKLLEVEFEWLLPGHGYRVKYKDVQTKNAAMETLIANYTS